MSGTEPQDTGDDSFDALLRQAAPVYSAAPAMRRLAAGTALAGGRLTILRKLGEGGMGVVYEAFDAQRKCRVACKTLTRIDAAGVYRLKNEFRALADVAHENLVKLHELFSDEQAWFFTMDLVDGEHFDRWAHPGGMRDITRVRAALPQLVAAIGAVHAAGKLHRDLKPSNVLVTQEGRLVVLDFGLSVDPELGGVGQTVADEGQSGTPAYMAPEQAAGRPATAASDRYALGVMLFEALVGRLPFEGSVGEMLAAKQRDVAPRASALSDDVPADLDALCAALLAREEDARPDLETLCAELGLDTAAVGTSRSSRASLRADARIDLLGRDRELALLGDAFTATLAGRAVAFFVSGESGMGKSALVSTFADELRESGRATVLSGRCYERENVPYKGFDALVDELSRHLRKLPAQEAAALLPREVYALARIFPVLDRVPVVADAPKKIVPDPQDLKQRAFAAFGEIVARMRDRAPLVLVVDDVQWIDQDSMRFLSAWLVQPEPGPVLLLCVHRSEGALDNALLQSVVQAARDNAALDVRALALPPMPHDALVTLAQRLLPSGVSADASAAFATEAQGSPFFAAELSRAAPLHDAGKAPLSLAEALSLHVASLPASGQRLLSVLALAGQPLPPLLAIEATNVSDGHALLDRLRGEQLARVSFDRDGARTVECYHDKIREQVSAGLDALQTRELGAGLARALRAREDADDELLARALEFAGMPEQSAEHMARAAERAFSALAFGRAATLYTRALEQGRFASERQRALRIGRAEALSHAGQGERAGEAFIEAAQGTSGDEAYDLTRKAGEQYLMFGQLDRGRELLAQAMSHVGISFPRSLLASLASFAWSRLRLRLRGLKFTPRVQHDAQTLRELEALRTASHGLVRSDQLHAIGFNARWVLRALDAGHAVELGRALAWEVLFASNMGQSAGRIAELKATCAQLYEQTGDAMTAQFLAHTDGIDHMMRLGDCDGASVRFERMLELLEANPSPTTSYDRTWTGWFQASCSLASGRFVQAYELGQAQLEEAVARGDQMLIGPAAQTTAMSLLALDRPEQAQRIVEQALARFTSEEVTLPETPLLFAQVMPALYRGQAREGWYAGAPGRARLQRSFMGRYMWPGVTEAMACGVAAAAALQTESPAERRTLALAAERLGKRGNRARAIGTLAYVPSAVVACMRGDRQQAIAALRARLREQIAPYAVHLVQYRIGELLGGEQGRALVAEAESSMRAGGVVKPARFAAAMLPGVELPQSTA